MKKIVYAIMAILVTLMFVSIMPVQAPTPRHCKGLDIYFYETPDAGWAAIVAGEIDFMQWSLTYEQYLAAGLDPTIQLAGYAENGMMEFDLNNNYTIASIPGVRSPMHHPEFRKAIAQMVDKDWIVNEVCMGFGQRIDAPIAAPQAGYANESVIGVNYPFPFDMDAAAARLDAAGFDDVEPDGTRNYPAGWPGRPGRPNLDAIVVCIRSDHGHRLTAGNALEANMVTLGIPTAPNRASSAVLFPIVMDARDYHIYTGGWSLGRRPTYMYSLFHSLFWFPGGSNYVSGMNASNLPNYPDYDAALEDIFYAIDIPMFEAGIEKASGLHVYDYCINIPLWSYSSWWAYRKVLVGIVNMEGGGLENTYTFLNAYKVDDPETGVDESQEPIKMGLIHPPKDLNILYSTWYYDYAVLDRVFAYLISVNPYNLAIDNPWIAQDWFVESWYDPQDDEDKTKVTYWIRKDVWWHAPITGEVVRQFTAHDVEFTIWYHYAFDDAWTWSGFKDVHHTVVVNDFTIEVYFDSASIWHVYNPTGPLLPKDEYLDLLCAPYVCEFPIVEPRNPSDKDILPCPTILQMIEVTSVIEGSLIEYVDYEVFATGPPDYCHQEIHWLIPLQDGDVVTFTYWTPTADPHGFYLANLDWSLTFYSIGPYYPIAIAPLSSAILDCNPTHFLGAPPLGEIDWMWTWQGVTKPWSGYYQVNIFDAVVLLKAYGSRGDTAIISPRWFPGADLDSYELCYIGLFDAIVLLTVYGQKFGIPPDP